MSKHTALVSLCLLHLAHTHKVRLVCRLWLALAATVYLQVNVHTNVQMWLYTAETQVIHVWCTFSNLLGSTVTCYCALLYNY